MVLYLFIYEKKNLHKRIVKLIEMREDFNFWRRVRTSPLILDNVERSFQLRPWIKFFPVEERAELLIPQIWQIPWDDTLAHRNNCLGAEYEHASGRIRILSYVARVNRWPHDPLIRAAGPLSTVIFINHWGVGGYPRRRGNGGEYGAVRD